MRRTAPLYRAGCPSRNRRAPPFCRIAHAFAVRLKKWVEAFNEQFCLRCNLLVVNRCSKHNCVAVLDYRKQCSYIVFLHALLRVLSLTGAAGTQGRQSFSRILNTVTSQPARSVGYEVCNRLRIASFAWACVYQYNFLH